MDNDNLIKFYWSRIPGKIVFKKTGEEAKLLNGPGPGPVYNFSAVEWYQTLLETIMDVTNTHVKNTFNNNEGAEWANKIVVSKVVHTILECMVSYKSDAEDSYKGVLHGRYEVSIDQTNENKNTVDLYFNDKLVGQVVVLDVNII